MKILAFLKIAGKLYLLIVVAILGMVGIAGIGLYQTGKVFESANYATANTLPSFNALNEIELRFQKMQLATLHHVQNMEETRMVVYDREIQDHREAIVNLLDRYAAQFVSNDQDKQLLDAVRAEFKTYISGNDLVLTLSRSNRNIELRDATEKNVASTIRLEEVLRRHVDFNEKLAKEGSASALATQSTAVWVTWLFAVAMILMLCILGWLIAKRELATPISKVVSNLNRLAGGSLDVSVFGVERRDEIGDIARAAQIFKEFVLKLDAQGWIKTHGAEISAALQQANDITALTQLAVSKIAPVLNAGHAALYVSGSDGRLRLLGSYGYRERKNLNNGFAIGEGLVGQCAMERQPISLTAPQDYIQINSGLGEAPPACISVLPIVHNDSLLGVFEIASFQQFTERQIALLDSLMPVLAVSMEIMDRNQRTRDLLVATQEQSERMEKQAAQLEEQTVEMEAQQAELLETENWFRSIIETAPDGILVVNESQLIVLANPGAEHLFGYAAGELVGQPVAELMALDAVAPGSDTMRLVAGQHQDGHAMTVSLHLSSLPSRGRHGQCVSLAVRPA